MLTVWGRKTSSNVQAAMWCIGELGLAFTRHDIGHKYGGTDTPAFLAMNPNGLVPVLRDGDDEPLWETGAILRYLASRYGVGPFWPEDLARRAQVDKWAEWSKINVGQVFSPTIFFKLVRTPAKDRDPAAIAAAVDALMQKLDVAEAQLSAHPYLAGDVFTLADVQLGHVLFRYFDLGVATREHPALASLLRPPERASRLSRACHGALRRVEGRLRRAGPIARRRSRCPPARGSRRAGCLTRNPNSCPSTGPPPRCAPR